MKPEVGDIWFCTYNKAYFLIIDIDKQIIRFRWLDTWEEDETEFRFFVQRGNFPYNKVA